MVSLHEDHKNIRVLTNFCNSTQFLEGPNMDQNKTKVDRIETKSDNLALR